MAITLEYKYVCGETRTPSDHEKEVNKLSAQGWMVLTVSTQGGARKDLITVMYREVKGEK